MSVNASELYGGAQFFSTRGLVEVQDFYEENGMEKIRFWLHTVDAQDGVSADGGVVLMSALPDTLLTWINRFPVDIEARRQSIVAIKNQQPSIRESAEEILERIKTAREEGPNVENPRYTVPEESEEENPQ